MDLDETIITAVPDAAEQEEVENETEWTGSTV